MRGGAAAVEQAGLGEDEGARADARHAAGVACEATHVAHELGVGHGAVGALTADDHQRVDRAGDLGDGLVGHDGDPAGGAERSRCDRGEPDPVGGLAHLLVGGREHLGGPHEVEPLEVGEHHQDHVARRHASILRLAAVWRQ